MSDDLSHDTHLRAALRHAPDHALAPPAGISQTILSAARHVHRPVRAAATAAPVVRVTVAPPRALAWLRQWFASPRLAGGLATGLVAALGLGLWLDLGDQPVIERPAADTMAQMRSAPAPAAPGDAGVDDTRDAQPAPARAPAPATEAARPRSQAAPGAAAQTAVPDRKAERAPRPAPPPATAESARREQAAAQEAEAAVAKAAAPAPPAPMADTAATPAPAGPTASAEVERLAQRSDASSRSEQRMLSAAGRAAAAAAPDDARAAMAPETGAAVDATSAGSPAFALLRRARAESAAGAARWAWTPPGSPLMAPFDDAGQAWLARVVQATRGRWTDVAERSGGDAIEVRWWRDEWPQATLRLEADGMRWIEQGGRIRFAPLEAAALARLRNP